MKEGLFVHAPVQDMKRHSGRRGASVSGHVQKYTKFSKRENWTCPRFFSALFKKLDLRTGPDPVSLNLHDRLTVASSLPASGAFKLSSKMSQARLGRRRCTFERSETQP